MLKIGMVCYPTYGGSGVVATELGMGLAQRGHQIHFITYSQPARLGILRENIFYHEVSVSNYPLFDFPPYELALAGVITETAKAENLDLVHVHYAIPHASAAILARDVMRSDDQRLPVVTTLHGTDITVVGQDGYLRSVLAHALNASDAVTAVSHSLRDDTQKNFALAKDIHVIPNFIDLRRFQPDPDNKLRKLYAPDGEPIISHVSNFRRVKRVDDVVRAFDLIRREVPARLFMIGDGPERSHVEYLCRVLDIQQSTTFFGKLESPAQILECSDLFMLPSEQESFGLAALEAMACGVPVISTGQGGLPELNQHGITGFLSAVGDIEDMATNAVAVLKDDRALAKLRTQARRRAEAFDMHRIIPYYEQVYRQVLG